MPTRIIFALLLSGTLGFMSPSVDAQAVSSASQPSTIYFVSIGSLHHLKTQENQFELPRDAPLHSATTVASLLKAHGARYGILLLSDENHFISRNDMLKALIDLKHRSRNDASSHPVIVFYYCGHGLGDAYNKYLYIPPGNLVITAGNSQTFTVKLLKSTVSNLDVLFSLAMFKTHSSMAHWDDVFATSLMPDPTDPQDTQRVRAFAQQLTAIDNQKLRQGAFLPGGNPAVPFIALFDNCYDRVLQDLVDLHHGTFSQGPWQLLAKGMQSTLDNELAELQEDGLVLYAAEPGHAIRDFSDPADPKHFDRLGALAWRLQHALADKRTGRSLGALRSAMLQSLPAQDAQGKLPPVPFELGAPKQAVLQTPLFVASPSGQASPPRIERRLGTATTPTTCCRP